MGITDTLKSVVDSVGNPNREEEAQNSKVAHEHVAMGGAGMSDHEQPQSLYDALHGDSGLRNMKAHGNIASGHDAGLGEEMAERSRLRNEGLFEPHKKHDELLNLSDEHRDVAGGSRLVDHTGVGASDEDERLV
ncbi:hypothetical protein C6P46_005397 [Rhodotorula mucilaginosa]|uniref:Uncharacterized protein n=1 Tax=Rhodotorula mucilaginosa TaxID=5537 RepID=A0A9P6VZ02_RHOMI|nr:hypothetical protein C6P46_005397 [Rhodotorula mucilaginosa]